mmetsp:Transcript_37314/g.81511  ORF Transcript_37314/g.81511 Transcript_37314/m.81511 type:complete len:194 (+) Transcript_37314:105-686(+)
MDSTLRRTKSRLTADEFSVAGSDVVDGEDDFEDEVASNPDGDANEEVLYEFEAPADGPGAEVVPRHRGPLPFVDSNIFQLVIGSVILSNVVVMILEAKYPEEQRWWAIENIFLPIYVFELLSRVVHYGCLFFYHPSDMYGHGTGLTCSLFGAEFSSFGLFQWSQSTVPRTNGLSGCCGRLVISVSFGFFALSS